MRLRSTVILLTFTVVTAACGTSPAAGPPTTTRATGSIDCATVASSLAQIKAAEAKMTTVNDATSSQIAADVAVIDHAVNAMARLSRSTLPRETAVWVSQTDAYAAQMHDGARSGKSVSQLLMDAHAFSTSGYANAAKAVAAFFTAACPA